jgi:hypothetical protein
MTEPHDEVQPIGNADPGSDRWDSCKPDGFARRYAQIPKIKGRPGLS